MRKIIFSFLLLAALFCAACGKMPQVSQADKSTGSSFPSAPAASSSPDSDAFSCSGSGTFSHDSLALPQELSQPVRDLIDSYYRSIGKLELQPCRELFSTEEEADRHEAVWHSLIELRKSSLIDLRLVSYDFTLTVTDIVWYRNDYVELAVTEDAEYRFAAIADTLTQQYATLHTFSLVCDENSVWRIDSHESDDSPYYNFDYDEASGADRRLSEFLQDISARQSQHNMTGGLLKYSWDHDYDRSAAYSYMQTYIERRNDDWYAYDDIGGNCQNFGSQVLLAGGIPVDEVGDAQWYWYDFYDADLAWINVDHFLEYAQTNRGYGLVANTQSSYYTGQCGDILILGDEEPRHTTVITDTVTDENGNTVDYLLCSNTSNYRNFPASAYYYTKHWLVRICGWND